MNINFLITKLPLLSFFLFLFLLSCDKKQQEQVLPTNGDANARKVITNLVPINGCPPGQYWDNVKKRCISEVNACPAVSVSTLNTQQRAKAISMYGAVGASTYDQVQALTTPTQAYISAYSPQLWNYVSQMQFAVINASNAYAASVSSTAEYSAGAHVAFIITYLTPIIKRVNTDPSLTPIQRAIMLEVMPNILNNFAALTTLVSTNLACFSDTPDMGTANSNGLGDGAVKNGWVGRFLKKAITVSITIQVSIIEKMVAGAVLIATGGALLGQPFAGALIGATVGGFVGLIDGISRCFAKKYVCVFANCHEL